MAFLYGEFCTGITFANLFQLCTYTTGKAVALVQFID